MDTSAFGTFCWAEVAAGDQAAAQKFYTSLFGWGRRDVRMAPGWTYTVFETDGEAIAGLYEIGPVQRARGALPAWHAYVLIEDCDVVTAAVLGLGGAVLRPPIDLPDVGRMAVVQDPQGAIFCLWEEPPGSVVDDADSSADTRDGRICWNELATVDVAAAARFYAPLFGWTWKEHDEGGEAAGEFLKDGKPVAGMRRIPSQASPLQPHWLVYVAVADVDFIAHRAVRLGGRIIENRRNHARIGSIAVLGDPDDASFAVVRVLDRD